MSSDRLQPERGRVTTEDGQTIAWRRWGGPQPKAILFFVHGLAEHGGRYGFPIEYFVPRGFTCWALDLRGHGESSGRRVHVQSFDDYGRDIDAVLPVVHQFHDPENETGRSREGRPPIFLVGHSMGGLVTLRYLLDHGAALSGAIVSSPALAAHPSQEPPRALQVIATVLSRLTPRLMFSSDLDVNCISRDPDVVEAYRQDPLVGDRVSARWFTSIRQAMADVGGRAGEVEQPVLLMQSGADRLVDPEGSRRWAAQAPDRWLEYVEWPEFFHEMFNEPQRAQVFERMATWLDAQLEAGGES